MYTKELLSTIDIFNGEDETVILDPLTGAISRGFFEKYIKSLLEKDQPFSLGILDIDNFKLINDSYGHATGDKVLAQLAKNLIAGVGDRGLVARFGGDEFLILNTKDNNDYDSTWSFYKQVLDNYVRKKIAIETEEDIYITVTSGIARSGHDGINYDDLFLKADKALYRGKQKGRNCFIIYLDSKHKHIDLSATTQSMSIIMQNIHNNLTNNDSLEKRLKKTFAYICDLLSMSGVYYFDCGKLVGSHSREKREVPPVNYDILEPIFNENKLFSCNDYSPLKHSIPLLHEYCWKNKIKSIILARVSYGYNNYGYLVFTDCNIKRIWQEDAKTVTMYMANSLGIMRHYGDK